MPSKFFYAFLFFSSLLYNTVCFSQETPIPDWVKGIGGTGESKLAGIGVDKDDNVYVAGNFQGIVTVDHSGISTPIMLTSNGSYDIYIAKYTPDGKLLWAKSIGGSNLDQVNNLAVDKDGNVILGLSSTSNSIDCDPGIGIFIVNSKGGEDALVVKLSTDGIFKWAQSVGGTNTDRGHVITADKDGNVIFVGSFSSSSVTIAGNTLINKGNFDGFVVKYGQSGDVLWSAEFGSSAMDEIKSVKTDSNGAIAIMGYYGATINLNPRGPAKSYTASGQTYFLAKYSSAGILDWANTITGTSTIASISIGPSNDVFLTGVFSDQLYLNGEKGISGSGNAKYLLIAKFGSDGKAEWFESISSNATNPYSYYITVDKENNAYIGGFFDQTLTFNINGTSRKTLTYNGGRDTFFAKYSSNGYCQWAFNFGSGCTGNFGHKIDVDSKKNVLLGGAFCKTVDFNPGNCELNLTAKHSNSDGYIAKFNQINLTGAPQVIKFELAEQKTPATIDIVNKKITIEVKAGTDISNLKPKIETDIGVLNPLSDVRTDFTTPKPYKISSNCVDYFWEVTITIDNLLTISTCSGEVANLIGESNTGGIYQWEISSNNVWTNALGNSTQKDYQATNIDNLTDKAINFSYRRKKTVNSISSYDSYTLLVVYPAIQNNSISTTQNKFCTAATTTFSGSVPSSATQTIAYNWQKSVDNNNWVDIVNATNKDYTASGITETTFFRRISSTSNCTSYSNAIEIKVNAPPTVTILGNSFGCANSTLTATGGITYLWSGGNTPNQATNTFNTSGTYKVIVTNTDGCSTELSKTITIGAAPTAITGNLAGCNSVTLTASGGVTYLWNGGKTPDRATNTFSSSGTYNVTITDANGCVSTLQRTVSVSANVTATINITAPSNNICAGDMIRFTPTFANAGANPTFKWLKNGVQVSTSETYNATDLKNEDEILCEITGSNACSVPTISNKIKITVNPLPSVSFANEIIIENDGSKVLQPNVTENALTYRWSPSLGLDNPNIKNPRANPESTTVYTLRVIGTGGCTAQGSVKVVVLKDIFIPNVFSPNGDGKNDQWVIRNIASYTGTKVQIFNRYGQKVFQSDNFISPWDGLLAGKSLPLGNYYYILDLANKSKSRYKGSVTILR